MSQPEISPHNLNKLQFQLFRVQLVEFLLRIKRSRDMGRHDIHGYSCDGVLNSSVSIRPLQLQTALYS